MKVILLIISFICLTFTILFAQTNNSNSSIQIALPFLLITPDARAAGMGDVGVSTAPDVYSMYWNAAKYFAEQKSGIGISITPWKRQLADDMNVFYLSGFQKLGKMQTLAASIKYL